MRTITGHLCAGLIFTMSPLAPEAPTGPYRGWERINESYAETFCGQPAVAEGRGDEGKWGGLVKGNLERYKDGLCSVLRFWTGGLFVLEISPPRLYSTVTEEGRAAYSPTVRSHATPSVCAETFLWVSFLNLKIILFVNQPKINQQLQPWFPKRCVPLFLRTCRHQIYNDCTFINNVTLTGDRITYLKCITFMCNTWTRNMCLCRSWLNKHTRFMCKSALLHLIVF